MSSTAWRSASIRAPSRRGSTSTTSSQGQRCRPCASKFAGAPPNVLLITIDTASADLITYEQVASVLTLFTSPFGPISLANAEHALAHGIETDKYDVPDVDVLPVAGINVYDILRHEKLVLTKAALDAQCLADALQSAGNDIDTALLRYDRFRRAVLLDGLFPPAEGGEALDPRIAASTRRSARSSSKGSPSR